MNRGLSLHLGLNSVDPGHYAGWDGVLMACEADAQDMQSIASAAGFETRILLTEKATRAALQQTFEQAVNSLASGDIFLVTYSGHGGQIQDIDGDETKDARDETWCLYDGGWLDDENYFYWKNFPSGVRILLISDSCHSGTQYRRRLLEDHAKDSTRRTRDRAMPAAVATRTYEANKEFYDSLVSDEDIQTSKPNLKAALLSLGACQDYQLAADGDENGRFTAALKRVWDGGSFYGDYVQFHEGIRSLMLIDDDEQIPSFSIVGGMSNSFESEKPFYVNDALYGKFENSGIEKQSGQDLVSKGYEETFDLMAALDRMSGTRSFNASKRTKELETLLLRTGEEGIGKSLDEFVTTLGEPSTKCGRVVWEPPADLDPTLVRYFSESVRSLNNLLREGSVALAKDGRIGPGKNRGLRQKGVKMTSKRKLPSDSFEPQFPASWQSTNAQRGREIDRSQPPDQPLEDGFYTARGHGNTLFYVEKGRRQVIPVFEAVPLIQAKKISSKDIQEMDLADLQSLPLVRRRQRAVGRDVNYYLGSDLKAGHYMESWVTLQGRTLTITTLTRTVTWFGGYTGGVSITLFDAGGNKIPHDPIRFRYGVDGTAFGSGRRDDTETIEILPEVAERTESILIAHYWDPKVDLVARTIEIAIILVEAIAYLLAEKDKGEPINAGGEAF